MYSMGFVLKLKPGCYDEYKRRHDDIWPEMAALMSDNDMTNVIYRFDDWLFVYGTAPSKEAWERVDMDPLSAKWNEYMLDVLEVDSSGQIFCRQLPLAFEFGVQRF